MFVTVTETHAVADIQGIYKSCINILLNIISGVETFVYLLFRLNIYFAFQIIKKKYTINVKLIQITIFAFKRGNFTSCYTPCYDTAFFI